MMTEGLNEDLFVKKAEFISWCIEEYSHSQGNVSSRDTANDFSKLGVLEFLDNHYDILHTQGKSYIIDSINDYINLKRVFN